MVVEGSPADATRYLVDTSVWMRLRQEPVQRRLDLLPNLYVCTPVVLEVGYTARSQSDHDQLMKVLRLSTEQVYLTVKIENDVVGVQRALAEKGFHRAAKLSDLLIAATAGAHGLTVLHYDSDFDLIAGITGQPCEWVVPRGSVD